MTAKKSEKKPEEPQPMPRLVHARDPEYKEFYTSGAFGGFDSQGCFHVIFYSPNRKIESINGPEHVVEISHKAKAVMSATTLKQVIAWLSKSLEDYETKFGKIEEQRKGPAHPLSVHGPENMYG